MFISSQENMFNDRSSQESSSNGLPSEGFIGKILSQESHHNATRRADYVIKGPETAKNDLKSSLVDNVSFGDNVFSLDDNVSSPKFSIHSTNSQESLQTPDLTRPPSPVVESQPSVVSSCQPSVKPQVRSTRTTGTSSTTTKVKRNTLPVQKGPARQPPKRKESPECTTVSSSEPFMGHLQSSKRVSSVKRHPLALITNRVCANSVSSTVSYESESRSEHSSLDHLDKPSRVSSITSGFPVISSRPNKQVKAPINKAPTTAKAPPKASSKKSMKLSPPIKPSIMTEEEIRKEIRKARNRVASKKLRDKKKEEVINWEIVLDEYENENKALKKKVEEFKVLKIKRIQKLLQAGVTLKEIKKKLQLANA